MSHPPISNAVALRIGLAANALPAISITELVDALHACLGEPLDEAALGRITVTNLKQSLKRAYDLDGEEDGGESTRTADIAAFKEAVRILWGRASELAVPTIDLRRDDRTIARVRVAVASNEGENLDGHFGSCLRFLVYDVGATELRLVDIRSTLGADSSPDKNGYRVALIHDCDVLYAVSIGGPAAAKVIKADIHIVQNDIGGPAPAILDALRHVVAGSPPPWLAKRLARSARSEGPNEATNPIAHPDIAITKESA